ncbi:unnamed protein product [Nyctereutes procyonoides]|uniref:(raccoon dog) hypothetical protein n=1 Tax=Nyctereutes procyonoides TaxID=34880 RepID=A0A811ZR99_NYCPR|nr:unnamed protein product [Nyctereutes procyonoides]
MCSLPLLTELPVETAVAEGPGTVVSKVDGQQVHLGTKEDSLLNELPQVPCSEQHLDHRKLSLRDIIMYKRFSMPTAYDARPGKGIVHCTPGASYRVPCPLLLAGFRVTEDRNAPPALLPCRALGRHVQAPLWVWAMPFLITLTLEHPEVLDKVSRELWMHVWSWDEDILEPRSILAAIEKAGMSTEQAQTLLEKISTPKVENKIKETTAAASKYGAFELPVAVAHLFGKQTGPVPPAINARF